jgi:hypothetical protein
MLYIQLSTAARVTGPTEFVLWGRAAGLYYFQGLIDSKRNATPQRLKLKVTNKLSNKWRTNGVVLLSFNNLENLFRNSNH